MIRSIRFRIAALLSAILLCCIIWRYCAPAPQQTASPAASSERAAETACSDVTQQTDEPPADTTTAAQTTAALPETAASAETAAEQPESEPDASVPEISAHRVSETVRKMQEAAQYSGDLIGWIYVADSEIDYPIVQGTDNQFYLHHAPDGRAHPLGSIFLSAQCARDFSGPLSILYGHNMQSGMFGDIRAFKEREAFDRHKYGWLFTMDSLYRIDFYALAIVSAYDAIYDIPADRSVWQTALRENSLYHNDPSHSEDTPVIALSTCASDFVDARALFTGQLVWVQDIHTQNSPTEAGE